MTKPNDPHESNNLPAYERPDPERAASSSPTENILEYEALSSRPHDPYAALRIAGFRWYSVGWVLSVIGQQLQSAAIGWEIFGITHRPSSLGWVGVVQAIPVIVLVLPAGQLADLASRRKIIVTMQWLAAACSLMLAYTSFRHGSVNALYAWLFTSATCNAISGPARSAILPQIVPADRFSNAISWNSSFFQVAAVAGPALASILIVHSAWPAYVGDACCAAAFGALAALIPIETAPQRRTPATLQSLADGIRFVWRTKIILATITLDLFAVLLGGATFLLPALTELLHAGSFEFCCLRAAPAFGAFAMAMLVAHMPPMKCAGRAMLLAVAGFGVATVLLGISHSFEISLAMLVLTGAFDNISVLVRHTLVQLLTPDEMRGRVSAVNNVFIGASNELGGAESGFSAQAWGTRASIIGGGIGTILVVSAVAFIWPEVRKFGALQDAAAKN